MWCCRLIGPSIVGIGMFGFTLSWDEIARTSQAIGDVNTLPLELQGLTSTVTTPAIYALGTVTTVVSLLVMAAALGAGALLRRRSTAQKRDDGAAMPTLLVINPNTSASSASCCSAHVQAERRRGRAGAHPHRALRRALHRLRGQLRGRAACGARCLGGGAQPGRAARCGADRLLRRPGPVRAARRRRRAGQRSGRSRFAAAAAHGRFAIVTGGERWRPMLARLAHALGYADARRHPYGGAERRRAGRRPEGARRLLARACREAAERFGAQAVILGGAGLAGMAADIARCRCRSSTACRPARVGLQRAVRRSMPLGASAWPGKTSPGK